MSNLIYTLKHTGSLAIGITSFVLTKLEVLVSLQLLRIAIPAKLYERV